MDRGLIARHLGRVDYAPTEQAMRAFTAARTRARTAHSADELWFLEHPPVFTQGQAGRAEHVLDAGAIPVVQTNRGGQVTYHGPGQLVMYPLLDLNARGLGIRALVSLLERAMIATLAGYGIDAHARDDAPGVYVTHDFGGGVDTRKIGSLGLRVSRGCSYHGLSLNVAMDLAPFARINPCGHAGLRMTQIGELGGPDSVTTVAQDLEHALRRQLSLRPD